MKKNKKLLLASIAAMGVLAMGVGATSTFAWFQATTSAATINKAASITGTITVNKPSASVSTAAKITFAVDTGSAEVGLSTWDSSTMKTGTVPSNVPADANEGTIASNFRSTTVDSPYTGYVGIYAVTAVLSDDSSNEEKAAPGHDAAWKAAVYAVKDTIKHVQFTCTTTGSASALGNDEVYFYALAGDSATYDKSKEGVSGDIGKTQGLQVEVEDLITISAGAMTGVKAAQTIGYLYVRLEGKTRVHTSNSYSVTLTASAEDGAASANA